jgi:multidrug efflux pump subunit AcrB
MFSRYNVDRGNISLVLDDSAPVAPKVIERMIEADLPQVPDMRVRFNGRHRGFGGGNNALSLRVIGPSTDVLIDESEKLIEVMEGVEGLTNVRSNAESKRQEVVIRLVSSYLEGCKNLTGNTRSGWGLRMDAMQRLPISLACRW